MVISLHKACDASDKYPLCFIRFPLYKISTLQDFYLWLETFLGNWAELSKFYIWVSRSSESRGQNMLRRDWFLYNDTKVIQLWKQGKKSTAISKQKTMKLFGLIQTSCLQMFHQSRRGGDVMFKPLNCNNAVWKAQGVSYLRASWSNVRNKRS